MWRAELRQRFQSADRHVDDWWIWVEAIADSYHEIFQSATLHQREQVLPHESTPRVWHQIEGWIRKALLAALPKPPIEAEKDYAMNGVTLFVHTLFFL